MTPNDPHLFQLFWGLRHTVGLDLRLDDYELLVEAWAEGFQPSDYLELQALCRRLWTRSPEEQARFNQYFELYFCQYIDLEQAADSPLKAVTSVPPSETLDPSSAPLPEQVPPSSSVPPPSPASSSSSSSSRSTVPERSWNETQVSRAVPVQSLDSERFSLGPFTLNDEYFRPLTRRQLQQGWRRLRSVIKQGESDQLDIPATVKQISQQGMLLEPCYRPKEINCTEVLLLVDRSNSMAPFDLMSERLISTAQQSLFRKDFRVLYHCSFRNYPVDTLYADPDLRRPIALASVLRPLNPLYTTALIFSDAGAARGGFNPARFEKTQQFIGMLRDRVRQLAWLNPLSPNHWQSGTAKLIAQEVPMVELDLVGWYGLLKDIRGQRVPALPSPAQLRYSTSAQPSRVQVEAQPSLDSIKQQLSKLVRESSDPARFEEAKQQILGFVRELPDSLDLLCHAAFPLALTPDLFYYLRENFQQDTPWQWVSEVLLSSVCHSVGYHLYELDYAVRHLLLKLLVRNPMFGRPRLYALSDSVLFYVEHRLDQTLYEANDFGEKPEWIALAYTEPNRLARQLAQRLEQTYVEGEVAQIQLASLATTLAEPLKEAQFEPLLSLIRGQSRLARGDKRGAKAVLDAISTDSIEVDDIRLRVPGRPDVSFPDAQVLEFDTAKYGESTTSSFPSLQARSLQVLTIEEDSSTLSLQTLYFEYVTLEQRQKRWEPVRHSAQCRQYVEALTEQLTYSSHQP